MANNFRFADAETIASTGAFLQGELERLDPKLYEPIAEFTALRDIKLREDVTIADSVSSFILSSYAANSAPGSKKAWAKALSSAIGRTSVDAQKVLNPMTPWAMEVAWNVIELAQAQQVGRPIDSQKLSAMRMKHDSDLDQQVYFGDAELGVKGLLNSDLVTAENVGALADPTDASKVISTFNKILEKAWEQSQYTVIPHDILISPALFSTLAATQLPNTERNLLQYVRENNIAVANGTAVDIRPCKYLASAFGGTGKRIVAYTNNQDYVRFPLVPLQHTAPQYRGLDQASVYYCAMGVVEFVRPQLAFYADLQ